MSATPHVSSRVRRGPDVLGELLHSLYQPLTGLRCSLELSLQLPAGLSIEEVAERRQESVAVALQQTENVIALVQLIREYLDAPHRTTPGCDRNEPPARLRERSFLELKADLGL